MALPEGAIHVEMVGLLLLSLGCLFTIKAAYSVTMNIFRKKKYFLFKSFAKVD